MANDDDSTHGDDAHAAGTRLLGVPEKSDDVLVVVDSLQDAALVQ